MPNKTPAEIISLLVQKIHYREYLIKQEGNEKAADEKYENIGQLINLADRFETKGID